MFAVLILGLVPGNASAHGGDDSNQSLVLVRQAIALIVNTPDDTATIADKVKDALNAEDKSNVDLSLVQQAKDMLAALQTDTSEALENLRDLARGIYPPLLADQGLVAALQSQARKSVVPVSVEADGVGRYPRETEAAVYFSCLEALQNVAKYANASRVTLRLSDGDHRLTFEVTDDGVGFDPGQTSFGTGLQGITDRLSAVGGDVEVRSTHGAGTSVTGHLPVEKEPPSVRAHGGQAML